MNKENIMFGIIGLLAGLIIGFVATNSMNKNGVTAVSPAAPTAANVPPGHPDIGAGGAQKPASGAMQPETQAALEKAKNSPNDFDAQVKAAEMYYQIERYDDAITYLTAANKLKPDDREVMVHLGNANFDSDKYAEAEKWYMAALAKKPDDINVRTDLGLTFVFREPPNYDRAIQEFNKSLSIDPKHVQTLQNLTVAYTKKGDAVKARETFASLEAADPTNTTLAKLKDDINKIGAN